MPHLSPFNWIITPIMFWFVLLAFSSFLWWSQSFSFPTIFSAFNYPKSNKWIW